jgi:O-antigen biosynthesis protein WbqV
LHHDIGGWQEVRLEDLLRREAVRIDPSMIRAALRGRRVLVTGAGGSIGSEICRQVAAQEPALLVLVDKAETALFEIDRKVQELTPAVRRAALLSGAPASAARSR